MRRVFLLHWVGNAVLILLLYVWLGIRDARAGQIAITVLLGAAILAGTVLLHAGTWHWMRTQNWRVERAEALRFTGALLLFVAASWLLLLIPVSRAGLWTASFLTFKSRAPVTPEAVTKILTGAVWLVQWLVLPVALFGQWRRLRFWLLLIAVLAVSWYLPMKLVHWTPDFKSTLAEVASLLVRWSLAYCLATAGWLVILREAGKQKAVS